MTLTYGNPVRFPGWLQVISGGLFPQAALGSGFPESARSPRSPTDDIEGNEIAYCTGWTR